MSPPHASAYEAGGKVRSLGLGICVGFRVLGLGFINCPHKEEYCMLESTLGLGFGRRVHLGMGHSENQAQQMV